MRHNSISILKFVLFIFYLNHILACVFYLIGDLEFQAGRRSWLEFDNLYTSGPSLSYLHAFYWSLMTITTTCRSQAVLRTCLASYEKFCFI